VKFVLEADDRTTRRALDRPDLGPPFEIVIAPPEGPRTKPKALNVALPLARGPYTAVFDAEDTPERDQLRRAVAAFRAADERLACLQASLSIDNSDDSWLVRMFTANYAGQFDVLLPGLAALQLPFPLGGSSNHFRGIRQQAHLTLGVVDGRVSANFIERDGKACPDRKVSRRVFAYPFSSRAQDDCCQPRAT
jgi:cellulose synthase/poly-beta-1,6-N-acetylglucosamine synthase-like glycosyltransferase